MGRQMADSFEDPEQQSYLEGENHAGSAATKRYNLQEFQWSEDGQLIITKGGNETYRGSDTKTGKLVGFFDKPPDMKLKSDTASGISVKKIMNVSILLNQLLSGFKVVIFSRTELAFDISHDNGLFVGGRWLGKHSY